MIIEVIVVDNDSNDGSPEMVREHFPDFRLIKNTSNLGFSKANNIGIKDAKYDRILLLNPDTIVFPAVLEKSAKILNENAEIATVGTRMLDGLGNFLPESKRGIPVPWRSFAKLSGLWKLRPRSKSWAGYYAIDQPDEGNGHVEILSGAFLMFDREKLRAEFLLDEDFFMFGEDIDFSYRVLKNGFRNHYLGEEYIIHFKGESSDKQDPVYNRNFYGAMELFRKKHFKKSGPGIVFKLGIRLAMMVNSPKRPLERTVPETIEIKSENPSLREGLKNLKRKQADDKGVAFDPQGPDFKIQFEKAVTEQYRLGLFWSEIENSFFATTGKESRGWVLKPDA